MAAARHTPPMFMSEAMRRKLDVTSAMAWEALVESHVDQAIQFGERLADFEPIESALPRYLREMDVSSAMAAAVRTGVLTRIDSGSGTPSDPKGRDSLVFPGDGASARSGDATGDDDDDGWSLLRRPQRVVRGVIRRQRRSEEFERITQLALARAEESVIRTHIDNAIGFVALFEDQPFARAIQTYLSAVGVAGGRAQAIFQRTMARLADVHFGTAAPSGAPTDSGPA